MKVQMENGINYSRKYMAVIKTFQQTKSDNGMWGKIELLSLLKQDLIGSYVIVIYSLQSLSNW